MESRSLHRRVVVRVALLVVPPLLLLGLSELALLALGLGGRPSHSLGRGFDAEASYLVADPDVEGGWITQVFGDPALEVRVPARDGRERVLLVGGSNTQLLPEWRLAETLDALGPGGRGHEVVNLGRMGYGSARVRILLEQALPRLRPDVVVIYSGHNEFVERGFATEVESGGGWTRAAVDVLARLRTFRVFERALRVGRPPTDVDPASEAFARITWDEAMPVFDAYERNLEAMCRSSLAAGARVVLCTVIGNDYCPPQVSDARLPEDEAAVVERLLRQVVAVFPARLTLFPGGVPARLRVGNWLSGQIPAEYPSPALRPLSGWLEATPGLSRGDARSDSVEGAHWPPIEHWNASVRGLMRIVAANEGAVTEAEREALGLIAKELAGLLDAAPQHARALFLAGQVARLLGDRARGAALLAAAAAADCAPRRGNLTTNARVARVAAALPDVTLFDAASEASACCPDGLVGYEVMMDGCHLQPGARVALLDRLAAVLLADR